jgi:hypothetical protein
LLLFNPIGILSKVSSVKKAIFARRENGFMVEGSQFCGFVSLIENMMVIQKLLDFHVQASASELLGLQTHFQYCVASEKVKK